MRLILYGKDDFEKRVEIARRRGVEWIDMDAYMQTRDTSDILILTTVELDQSFKFTTQEMEHFKTYSSMIFVLPFTLVGSYEFGLAQCCGSKMKELQNWGVQHVFWDKMIYDELTRMGYGGEPCTLMGNPKFDGLYGKLRKAHAPVERLKKLEGRKRILWAFDHLLGTGNYTFDQYVEPVLRYFGEHREMGLIIRPHPIAVLEWLDWQIWTPGELERLKKTVSDSPNMTWDDDPDYADAYDAADAIVTDVQCGITVSALATGKPLCVFFRMGVPKHIEFPGLIDSLYQAQSEEEAVGFFEMIARGEDPLREKREQAFKECVLHFDGQNGQRMKDFIAEKYVEKTGRADAR